MNGLFFATTIDHALSLWSALQLDVDWTAMTEEPRLAVGSLDVVVPGAVARPDPHAYELIGGVPVVRHEGLLSKYPTVGRLIGVARRTRTYAELAETLRLAATDRKAQTRPLLVLDTPGGGVDGHTEAVRAIRETGTEIFVERGTSGGTWLAAASPRVTVASSGMMGSVGVIHIPLDFTGRLEREGVKPVPIVSDGAEVKAIGRDGSVDEEYVEKIKPLLNATARQFQADVREGRGLDDEQAAAIFTADVWIGAKNVRLGLADAVASDAGEVIHEMAARRRSTTTVNGGNPMPDVDPNASSAETNLDATAVPTVQANSETDLAALVTQLRAENEARQSELLAEREARETAMAQIHALETARQVDTFMARCADAPACLTHDLEGFFKASVEGEWTLTAADGQTVSAHEYMARVLEAAGELVTLSADDEEIADEAAPKQSRRTQGFVEAQEPDDPNAPDEGLDAAVKRALEARAG